MKRLAVITVGKTHSGKTTFAHRLEKALKNSFVMDQDVHAEFLNTYYKKLQPTHGPNTLKHALSQLIVSYAKEHTNFHIIASNSNRSKKGRKFLLEEIYPEKEFVRILVHFNISDEILTERVKNSERSTNIFRGAYRSFEEVLRRQQKESQLDDVVDPVEGEADYLFEIKDEAEVESTIGEIVQLADKYSNLHTGGNK
ncbi:AAA family ATPase [Ornithinibacillus halotolerans]|uniref:CRISPR-associated endoribonuclease Cas2 n=1 Tax=Ornithinibacillus halotolerans TaxID=1274357 RepID=A0A916RYC8_9BACI|nr:AAA family ATPase [Ornithinibacillus halotolerans]GGA72242.1 CRISPR-associated endoribonuclease Cas2 [Ornithinibacillus halotolerans]